MSSIFYDFFKKLDIATQGGVNLTPGVMIWTNMVEVH